MKKPPSRVLLPPARPRITAQEVAGLLAPYSLNRELYPLVVVGERGYYRDTMGAPGVNDRGCYDDAISLVTPNVTVTFNGNTDPTEEQRLGLASLKPGLYFAHRFALHRGEYLALCQRAGQVVVKRDGTEHFRVGTRHADYGECLGNGYWKGDFGINIHRGGVTTTSSLGCQTIPQQDGQWDAFITLATAEAKRLFGKDWQKAVIPYLLVDRTATVNAYTITSGPFSA